MFVTNDVRQEQRTLRAAFAQRKGITTRNVCHREVHHPMNPESRHRSTRDRPAKAPLSEDAVVDAALAILKSEGLAAVTMRRVAAALDTGPASLYVYVPGREGLLQAMQDRIIAAIELQAPDPARWRAQLHSLLERMHRALAAHPGIAATAMAAPPTTEAVLRLLENLLGILLAGGLDPQDAAWATDIFALVVNYAAIEADVRRADHRQQAGELYQTFTALPPDRFPLITAHAAQLVAGDGEERFRVAIDVVIDGMLARAARR
jgi:AcrR family transcriptional regulator